MNKQPTCEERVDERLAHTLKVVRVLLLAETAGVDMDNVRESETSHCFVCETSPGTTSQHMSYVLCRDCIDVLENCGPLSTYGLCFDYVPSHMFEGQRNAYFRWQLSWGGPSDEFRFYANPDISIHRIEYWFLDWFDGAYRTLEGNDFELLEKVFDIFYYPELLSS